MRLVLVLVLVFSATLPVAARDTSSDGLVRVVVKTDQPSSSGALGLTALEHAHGWQRAEIPVQGTVEQTLANLSAQLGTPVVIDRRYELLGPESEPEFDQQWGLENTGQSEGTADVDIDATAAWPVATGEDVVVAVIDSGVDPTNEEFDDQLWVNTGEVSGDGEDNDGNGYIDDVDGWDFKDDDNDPSPEGASHDDAHATLISGVIAAKVNGVGITGVAPDATIMNLRACDDGFCHSFDVLVAMAYAVDNGAELINLSFGAIVSEDGDPVMEDAMDYALANDVLVVTAAGNTPPENLEDDEVILPAEYPHANNIAVAASDRHDGLAGFSYYSDNIDIAAPGVDILTTGFGNSYFFVHGTSFSAPFVAGVSALLLATDPTMSHAELGSRIKGFADRPTGIGTKVEAGRLNAGRSLTHQFIDAVGHLFEGDIEWLAEEGVTKGCNPPEGTLFCPDLDVSRGQMAAFLNRYLNLPAASEDYFIDDNDSIFEDDINRLAEAGITKGCNPPDNNHYCPTVSIDRGQMAAFLVRAFGLTDDGGGDLFIDDDNSIFEGDIDRFGTAGITKGCNPPTNDRYCPNSSVTRGAMAAFLHRAPSP